jgi:hypothetical protein
VTRLAAAIMSPTRLIILTPFGHSMATRVWNMRRLSLVRSRALEFKIGQTQRSPRAKRTEAPQHHMAETADYFGQAG